MSARGYVYAVRCGDFVKIGWSQSPRSRAQTINNASPNPCVLIGALPASRDAETTLHSLLRAYREDGEWFRYEGPVVAVCDCFPSYDRRSEPVVRTPTLASAIERIGGPAAVARHLGISSQAVSQWSEAPIRRVPQLAALAGIPPHELRPDIFEPAGASE